MTIKAYVARLESWLCWLPCMLTERWFLREVGGWRERVATRFVQGYYGAGRYYECCKAERGQK